MAILIEAAFGGAVDGRAKVLDSSNDLEKRSLDYYAVLRSVSARCRAALVQQGRADLVRPAAEVTASAAD